MTTQSGSRVSQAKKTKDDLLRITDQCRAKRGMMYDIVCKGSRLIISVVPRENEEDQGEWRVEARTSRDPNAVVISEWGATRAAALSETGRSWVTKGPAHELPPFDWSAVADVLAAVRAI